jgi:hypothetical protein
VAKSGPFSDLTLDIGEVDRAADVLGGNKAQDRHLAGLGTFPLTAGENPVRAPKKRPLNIEKLLWISLLDTINRVCRQRYFELMAAEWQRNWTARRVA